MKKNNNAEIDLLMGCHTYVGQRYRSEHYRALSFYLQPPPTSISTLIIIADALGFPIRPRKNGTEVVYASEVAIDTIIDTIIHANQLRNPRTLFTQGFKSASERIIEYVSNTPDIEDITVSCAAILILGDKLYTATIGDCRIYLLRQNRLQQISVDHTPLQMFLETRAIKSKEELLGGFAIDGGGPIYRYLGRGTSSEPDFRLRLQSDENDKQSEANQGLMLVEGDQLMLCTGEFHGERRYPNMTIDKEIQEILLRHPTPQQAAERLTALAGNSELSRDFSVIVVKVL